MELSDIKLKFLFPVLCFLCSLYGLYHYVSKHDNNMCEMTYMFEYPQYLKIAVKRNVSNLIPRYNLYAYGEGKYYEDLKNGKSFDGIPVLFVPGNAGSHRQVRSLASVAMRMGHSLQTPYHFNFFTVDFDEEISGLYGATLNEQTNFVIECLKHIQSLYSTPKKIILIGHSMGGVVIKALFTISTFNTSDISILITLSAPHKHPVITIDYDIDEFYCMINHTWKCRMKPKLANIPIVSIGGGDRDILVRSDLTINRFLQNSSLDVHVLTTSIPGVWVSTDHLAITWCKQLVLTICRSLYDLVDDKTKQLTTSLALTQNVLRHHFLHRSSGKHFPKTPFVPVSVFSPTAQWIEQENRAWRFSRTKVLSTIYLLIPLEETDSVVVVESGLVKKDWIYGCIKLSGNGTRTCSEGINLSDQGKIIPTKSKTSERRMINFDSEQLHKQQYTYILITISPVNSQVDIIGERFNAGDRTKRVSLPHPFRRLFFSSPVRILSISLAEQTVFHNITVPQAYGVFESVEFQLETRLCKAGSVVGQGFIQVYVPSTGEYSYYHIRTTLGGLTSIPIQAHFLHISYDESVNLQIVLDPECSIALSVKFPFHIVARQFMKFYGFDIIGYTVAILLAFFSGQLYLFESTGSFPSIFKVFGYYPTFMSLVPLPSALYISWRGICGIIPDPDHVRFQEGAGFFSTLFLRCFLYLISCGLLITVCTMFGILLNGMSTVWIWIRHKSIMKATEVPMNQNPKTRVHISHPLLVFICSMAALNFLICSSFALLICTLFYTAKLISFHARCKAEEERRGSTTVTTAHHFHSTLLLVLLISTVLTLPGLITWIKLLKFSVKVPNDPYILSAATLIICSCMFWDMPAPSYYRVCYKKASHVINALAILVTLYGIHSVYRLLYFTSFSFFVLLMQQIYAVGAGPFELKHD